MLEGVVGSARPVDARIHSRAAIVRRGVVARVYRRTLGRQSAQVDASDARAGHRAAVVPSLSAFHHARAVECAGRVATVAPRSFPHREGLLILDDTPFLKQGHHSVGVGKQYVSTLKALDCQVAVTAALWTGTRAWLLGAELYLPREWLSATARRSADSGDHRFKKKLTVVRRVEQRGSRSRRCRHGDIAGSHGARSRTPALHRRDFLENHGISGHADDSATAVRRRRAATAAPAARRRHRGLEGAGRHRATRPRVAAIARDGRSSWRCA